MVLTPHKNERKMKTEEYLKGYKDGQRDLIAKWNKWKFGLWFFNRQKKEMDKFIKEMNIDVSDITIEKV